jgi:putative ATP-dependent endonuclease of OLD family
MKGQADNDFNPTAGEPATIAGIVAKAYYRIRENAAVRRIEGEINRDYLAELSVGGEALKVELGIGASLSLTQVLERLELALMPPSDRGERVRRGLGLNNVLFMAAELLLLQSQTDQIPLLLVEEPEAHLHPQLQARFVEIMSERARQADKPLQIILTTHSPLMASGIPLEEITMVAGGQLYPLEKGATWLQDDDYAFLRRFLDATKANLFFAKGVLIVEGDAENLLLPALAEKAGKSLTKHGVSIVKVGHVGLFRYSRILRRRVGLSLPVPVACIADLDIPPDEAAPFLKAGRRTRKDFDESKVADRIAKLRAHDGDNVKTFPSDHWTLEYDLAYFGLAETLWQAIRLAEGSAETDAENEGWDELTPAVAAMKVYGYLLQNGISKAEVAQHLAALILELPDDSAAFRAKLPPYLVAAIDHVAPGPTATARAAALLSPVAPRVAADKEPATV